MRHTFFSFVVLFIVFAFSGRMALAADADNMFAQFIGTVQGDYDDANASLWKAISWTRWDFNGDLIAPKGPNDWNQKYLDVWAKRIAENRKHGIETLPILSWPAWSLRKQAWSFVRDGKRYDVPAYTPGTNIKVRHVTITDLRTGKSTQEDKDVGDGPPDKAQWEALVDKIVGTLTKPPYNLKYFQIWNEAHQESTGFWFGDFDDYFNTVHLPAAAMIRKHGGKVVYGGYPCVGSMQDYIQELDKHHAWDTLDVLDIHYFPLSAWQYLYDKTKVSHPSMAIWQTEIGFTQNKAWVPNDYPRFFCWAISHDWQPNRYQIFQFAFACHDDPNAYGYDRVLSQDNHPTYHGKALLALNDLLNAPKITPYTAWQSKPELHTEIDETKSSAEGFDCGDRIVLAIHLADQNGAAMFTNWNGNHDNVNMERPRTTISIQLPKLKAADVTKAWRVGIYGSRQPVEVKPAVDAGLILSVPVADADDTEQADNREAKMRTFYLVIKLQSH